MNRSRENKTTPRSHEAIIESWHGAPSREAIAESVRPAREVLINHRGELEVAP